MFEKLCCLKCGLSEYISLDFQGEIFRCDECESEWDTETARHVANSWLKVCDWVDQAPLLDDID